MAPYLKIRENGKPVSGYLKKCTNLLCVLGFLAYILVVASIARGYINIDRISSWWLSQKTVGNCQALERNKTFTHCDFRHSDFSGHELKDLNLEYLDLKGANFEGAVLFDVSFKGSNLNDANFKNSYILFTNFVDTCLMRANFSGAEIHKINHWRNAALKGSNFEETSFEEGVKAIRHQPHRRSCENM